MSYPTYLVHFNPNHDKLGRFTFKTTFISGSSKTTNPDSPYYRKELPKSVRNDIDGYMRTGDRILVGDAPGVDRQVQDYLKSKGYKNVEVYGPGKGDVRYSADKDWKTKTIDSGKYEPDSDEWRAEKDKVMSKLADRGLAIVLENGGAGATRDNIDRLVTQNKSVKVYELDSHGGITQVSAENSLKSKVKNYNKVVDSLTDEEYRLWSDGGNRADEKKFIKSYAKWQPNHKEAAVFVSKYGNVTLASLETNGNGDKEWNMGWATASDARGTGITQANVKEAISMVRQVSDLPISAIIEKQNIPSQRTAEKAGFKDAGLTRMNDGSVRKRYVYD